MRVEPHGMADAQDFDLALADYLAKLPLGHPVVRGNFRERQGRIAGSERQRASHHHNFLKYRQR